MKNKSAIQSGFVLGVALLAVGCSTTDSSQPKKGSYTAVRHMQTGSHIPQPESIDTANSTMDTAEMEREANNANMSAMRGAAGGAR